MSITGMIQYLCTENLWYVMSIDNKQYEFREKNMEEPICQRS